MLSLPVQQDAHCINTYSTWQLESVTARSLVEKDLICGQPTVSIHGVTSQEKVGLYSPLLQSRIVYTEEQFALSYFVYSDRTNAT